MTYDLSTPDDGLYILGWLPSGTGYTTRDLDKPGEDASADALFLAAVCPDAALDELDLARVEGGADLGHERTVERIRRAARGRARAVQHAGERVRGVEDADDVRGDALVVDDAVQHGGERGHVVAHDCVPHLGRARLGCRCEGLAPPHARHRWVPCHTDRVRWSERVHPQKERQKDAREGCSRAKRCSWIRVSWMLATFELVTMRQFMMPSETVSAIICRSSAWTKPGAAGEWSGGGGAPDMSDRAASRMSFKDTAGLRTTSPLHRWIVRSKFAPAF